MLESIESVCDMISQGKTLLLAGSEWALSQLPPGNWIGGTIPYFMDVCGGVSSFSRVFADEVPTYATRVQIQQYTSAEVLKALRRDAPRNGYSFIIMPGGSPVHVVYAQNASPNRDGLTTPVVGWVSGVHASRIGLETPMVFNGVTAEPLSRAAIVMHVELPPDKKAKIEMVNVFQPGDGDTITFPAPGFNARECRVNGQPAQFPEYMLRTKPDPYVPLTTSHNGTVLNVSIQGFEETTGAIHFYAPVFPGLEYRFAAPVPDYVTAFMAATKDHQKPAVFSCNCVLNYLYADLEGKHTGGITGPITFGEIADQLVNQTLVRLLVEDTATTG